MEIDKMEAGEELNAIIAEKVMGAKRKKGIWTFWSVSPHWEVYRPEIHQSRITHDPDHLITIFEFEDDVMQYPPSYSENMGLAWKVFEKFRKLSGKGWAAIGPNQKDACHESEADLWMVFDSGKSEKVRYGQGPTPMLAICRAALKAVL